MDVGAGRKVAKALIAAAMEPLRWEIAQLGRHEGHLERVKALKANGILPMVRGLRGAEQKGYVALLAETVEVDRDDILELLANLESNLYKELGEKFSEGLAKVSPTALGEIIYKWFEDNGGKFFHTPLNEALLFWGGEIIRVDNDVPFEKLIFKMTRLNFKERPGNVLYQVMKLKALDCGARVEQVSWMHTDKAKDTIYLNLTDGQNKIIKLAPGQPPAVMDNGTNEDKVLLNKSFMIKEFTYRPDADEGEAVRTFKRLVLDNTATENSMRYFIGCWALTCFLLDLNSDRGLLQLIGTSGVGKSKTPERLSYLFLGENQVGQASGAGNVRVAAAAPFIFLDNLENHDLTKERKAFLLLLANSASKMKARGDSEDAVVKQKLNALGLITSIESIPGKWAEGLNRTFIVELEKSFRTTGYLHDEVVREILHRRNEIMSGLLKMISLRVLPRLAARADYARDLARLHAGHNKERNNGHLATMALVLEAFFEHAHDRDGKPVSALASQMMKKWIDHQEAHAKSSAHDSNSLLYALNGLCKEIMSRMRGAESGVSSSLIETHHKHFKDLRGDHLNVQLYHDRDYAHEFFLTDPLDNGPQDLRYLGRKTKEEGEEEEENVFDEASGRHRRFEFFATGGELHEVIGRYMKGTNERNPFDNASSLGARVKNDRDVLIGGGWEIVGSDKYGLHHHKSGGDRFWRFRKRIEVD